jgi:hypothetical protein
MEKRQWKGGKMNKITEVSDKKLEKIVLSGKLSAGELKQLIVSQKKKEEFILVSGVRYSMPGKNSSGNGNGKLILPTNIAGNNGNGSAYHDSNLQIYSEEDVLRLKKTSELMLENPNYV